MNFFLKINNIDIMMMKKKRKKVLSFLVENDFFELEISVSVLFDSFISLIYFLIYMFKIMIGELKDGKITLLGRNSALIKLSQGAFVNPARLETIFEESPLIAKAFVFGHDRMANVAAAFCLTQNITNAKLKSELTRLAESHQLKAFEVPQKFVIESNEKVWKACETSNGKKNRIRLAEQFAEAAFSSPVLNDESGENQLSAAMIDLLNTHLVSLDGNASLLEPSTQLSSIGCGIFIFVHVIYLLNLQANFNLIISLFCLFIFLYFLVLF